MVELVGLALVLASSLAFAGFDSTRKILTRHMRPLPLLVLITVGQLPAFGAWIVLEPDPHLGAGYAVPALGSVLLNILANVLFLRAVEISDLSRTIPMLSLTPVFSTLSAFLVLGEWPSERQLLGIALVVVGAWLLNRRPPAPPGQPRPPYDRGALLMGGTALCWATTAALDKLALRSASVGVHGLLLSVGVGLGAYALLALRRGTGELRAVRDTPVAFVVGVVLAVAAMGLQFLALRHMLVSLVEAIKRAVGMSAAVLIGRWLFAEPITARKLVAVGMMSAGVVLVVV